MRFILHKICDFLFGKQANNSLPRYWVLIFDIMVLFVSYMIAMVLVHYNNLNENIMFLRWYRILIVMAVYVFMFLIYRTYFGMIRYSGFDDIRKIFNSCTIALAILLIAKVIITQINPSVVNKIMPVYKIMLYHYFLTMVIMVLSRFTIRRIYNEFYKESSVKKQNTLIYGAGEGGVLLLRAIGQDRESPYKIVAFTDDNPKKTNKNINTIPVYQPDKVFNNNFIVKNDIKVLILALPSCSAERKRELIELGMNYNLKVKTMPSFMQWVDGEINTNQIQDIKQMRLNLRQRIIETYDLKLSFRENMPQSNILYFIDKTDEELLADMNS